MHTRFMHKQQLGLIAYDDHEIKAAHSRVCLLYIGV